MAFINNDKLLAELEARRAALQSEQLLDLDALESKVVSTLPPYIASAWYQLQDQDPETAVWFGETLAEAEAALVKQLQLRILQVISNCAHHELGLCTCDSDDTDD